jgi:hypothetical protein
MPKPLSKLLRNANDEDLCSGVFDLIVAHYGNEANPSEMEDAARVFSLVYHTSGIIGNGGFNYLLEGDVPGDPDLSMTVDAYERVGCGPAVEAFHMVMNLFPDGKPPRDRDSRLEIYRSGSAERRGEIDRKFFKIYDALIPALARYIRQNADDLRRLEESPARPKQKPKRLDEVEPRQLDPVAVGLPELPHWARVAFAARCARIVFPLFDQLWGNALPRRRLAVQNAIRLAERAAAAGKPNDELKEAVVESCLTAGAALTKSLYGWIPDDAEPGPADGTAAVQVGSVAKAAENAAEAARNGRKLSAEFARHSYAFARDVACDLQPELTEQMARDFQTLRQAALRGRWTDRTPVPRWAFESTDGPNQEKKPWWQFW